MDRRMCSRGRWARCDPARDNITLQDGCDQDLSDHLTMMYSPCAVSIALRALDPAAHPNLVCAFNPWFIGGGGGDAASTGSGWWIHANAPVPLAPRGPGVDDGTGSRVRNSLVAHEFRAVCRADANASVRTSLRAKRFGNWRVAELLAPNVIR